MTREQARDHINGLLSVELQRAKKRNTFICPFCNNGSGADGDGISSKDGTHYKCFKCGYSGDYLDMLKKQHDTDNENDIFKLYNLTIDGSSTPARDPARTDQRQPVDYSNYFLEAQKALRESLDALKYLESRGISPEVATLFKLGYDKSWRSPAAVRGGKNPPASRRLIIPTGTASYTARSLDPDTLEKYRFMKEGEAGIFNKNALYGDTPVFVVEGVFDAMSVHEVGGMACALGSTSGVDKFIAAVKRERPTVPLILSLDNDEAGKKAQEKLRAEIEQLKLSFFEVNAAGDHKDANDHLTADRESFAALIRDSDPAEIARQEAEAERAAYLQTSASHHISAFLSDCTSKTKAIKTGFEMLDTALDGGLYEGLYIIGAISSLGKTAYVLQLADQIAVSGRDVLFFSLEMSRHELMARSISRLTLDHCEYTDDAKTTRGILSGRRWGSYKQIERELIKQSIEDYRGYSERVFIHEGVSTIGVEQIKQEVQKHISFTGNTPVVFIDYLQIVAPHDERATDKQITDKAVLELKRLSRDKKTPVIAVSSFNRDNYTAPVNMASFKESGAVEYSSDVLIGLQLTGMDELSQTAGKKAATTREIEKLKEASPRKAQLKILKNRNGRTGISLFYDYYAMFNSYRETDEPELDE